MTNKKDLKLIVLIFIIGTLFGFILCNFMDNNSNETSTITFFYDGSFSGKMPINPGYDIFVNVCNDTTFNLNIGDYSVSYLVTPNGLKTS